MNNHKLQTYFFLSVLGASALITLLVFWPYLTLLMFGGVLAVISYPFYKYLLKWLKSPTAAAFLTVLLVSLVVVIPSVYFFAALSLELGNLFTGVSNFFDPSALTKLLERYLPAALQSQIPAVLTESLTVLRGIVGRFSTGLIGLFSNLVGLFFAFIVILICVYYLLKDGSKIKRELLVLSPLGDEYDELVFQKVIIAIQAVMNGVLVMGLIKGVLAAVAFLIFGIPAPLFWGAMTGLASFLPIFGSGLITVPAVIYLLISGRIGAAIGLAIVSVVLIGAIDNFLQPKLVESKTRIHPLLILLSILGGMQFYGFSGFILGPLTLAVMMALLDIYKKDFRKMLENHNAG